MRNGGGAVREWTAFGTTMLTLVGTLNVSQGLLVGFASGGVGFNRNDVAFTSAGTWAAATVTLGVLLGVTGIALRRRKGAVKFAAAGIVALHAISQLAMLRAYPAWSLLMVTLDVIILFVLTVPRSRAAEEDDEEQPAPAPTAKLALRRNNRSDAYRGRHKAGHPIVRHSAANSDIILVDLMVDPEAIASETIEVEIIDIVDPDDPAMWTRAIGHATVPVQLAEPTEESVVPVQRATLDPLVDPLPVVIAAEDDEPQELAAIGARPYVEN
ncbi:hypothetical protein KZZ52_04560 [Dactylosporangium sp. AC04546]|uniref:DUF7144 family membrane protein n=1 Tax=Dactylosporangium sp. AC04546 TaxID=2862460 RepID=UPI001EDF6417|nr:hypothetical protein [Dactylosporangium sp. AC04546]WVK84692.1 hypothetical protein KZZ52_04560 [Dactylosporangium sp. AC04546]